MSETNNRIQQLTSIQTEAKQLFEKKIKIMVMRSQIMDLSVY